MHLLTALSIVTIGTPVCTMPTNSVRTTEDLKQLYLRGRTYIEFRDAAARRVDAWHDHYANAMVSDALRQRVNAIAGSWKLLVIAEDWCGDSANTIPYVAKLVDVATNLDMRIINSTIGRTIMERHRTPDGRTATPTVILLDANYDEAGCWVERPTKLATWFDANKSHLSETELYDRKYAWYAEDAGQETLREVVALMESASAGQPVCGRP